MASAPQPLQGQGGGGGGMAQEGPAPLLIGQGDHHGQVAVLLHRQQGGPALLQVGHGLHHHQVGPSVPGGAHLLGEDVHRRLEVQRAGGLQQLSDRAQIQGHQGASPGGLSGQGDGGGDDLLHRSARAAQLLPVGPEGVGAQDLAARRHIGPVDVQQPVRVLQGGQLGILPQLQPPGLEHGAHPPVQQDGAGGLQQFTKVHSVHQPFDRYSSPGRDSPGSCGVYGRSSPGRPPEWRSPTCGG